ncbi:TerD family protein [Kineococcus sp. SYSU DK004]|uniref:TerD family protein n=1 Tax=Kineococcus sp. SYSU DK004 TaxID=3383125 RepID=UPI003D7D6867
MTTTTPDRLPPSVAARYPHSYAVVDVETTGLVPEVDRVLQLAVTLLDAHGAVERSWSTLVDPQRHPGPVHVHGITADRLAGAPLFADVAGELRRLTAGRVVVAHNAQFDWTFLVEEMRRTPHVLDVQHRLCTRNLARRLGLPVVDLKLATLASYWQVEQRRAHDAEDDVRVLVEVLRRSLTAADELGIDLPLTPCTTSAQALAPVRRPVPLAPRRTPRAPRVECPWELPAPWRPGQPLVQGARVVITGDTRSPREELVARAVRAGLDVKNGVSRATTLLVSDDRTSGTKKQRDADLYGVPVVDEAEFERLLGAVAPGRAKEQPAPSPVVVPAARPQPVRTLGPFSRRRVLVLGGPHERAAQVRAEVVARGGAAAVNLTVTTTDVIALDGAERDRRWVRVRERGVPLLDPVTWKRLDGSSVEPERAAPASEPAVLPRGGVIDLPADERRWTLDVQWGEAAHEVDVVALRLDQDEQVHGDEDLVYFGALATPDGSVVLRGDTSGEAEVSVDLDGLPGDVSRVVVAAAAPDGVTFGDIGPVELTLRGDEGGVAASAVLDAATVERTLVLGELYERNGVWRFRARGQGYEHGLAELVVRHGVDVEQ